MAKGGLKSRDKIRVIQRSHNKKFRERRGYGAKD
jgi:hypothetical protein